MKLPDDVLRCTTCRSGWLALAGDVVRCGACNATAPVKDDVVGLLPHQPKASYIQKLMERPWIVEWYEGKFWRQNPLVLAAVMGCTFAEEQAMTLRSLALSAGMRVLDIACGSGIFTRPIARAVAPGVTFGLDLSQPMLACAARCGREEHIDNIVWIHGSAFDIPLADMTLDAVTCVCALHLFPDLPRVLREIFRVLKPGGRFAYGMSRRLDGISGNIQNWITTWSGFKAEKPEVIRAMLEAAGFQDAETQHSQRIWQIGNASRPQ